MNRAVLAVLAIALGHASPAFADTAKPTPGAPCTPGGGQGTGNPCNGNNGNPSPEGNARGKVVIDRDPPPFTIARPGSDRGAFIDQIGDGNTATIAQSSNQQYARIDQTGDGNRATLAQQGTGAHYARATQSGDANSLTLDQSGAGAQVAFATQTGDRNAMRLTQNGGSASGGIEATQLGDDNRMALTQEGDANQARLVQNGSGNAMTAIQNGNNNQLAWTQNGSNLSDLAITQSGGQAIQITQSR